MKMRNSNLKVVQLCGLFGYTRYAFYRRRARHVDGEDHTETVLSMVRVIRKDQSEIGTPRLYHLIKPNLVALGIKMGRNSLNEIIQGAGLGIRRRKRRSIRTTDSSHGIETYPNLIIGLEPDGPHQIWVTDITYLAYKRKGFCFLTLITDVYSHKIVGWHLSERMFAQDVAKALEMAISQLPEAHTLIHHSDRGRQFISDLYTGMLDGKDIRISMTEHSDPKENAIAERLNGILKKEHKLGQEHKNFQAATKAVIKAVEVYNTKRPHSSCDYLTPEQAHKKTGKLRKRWKNYRKEKAIRYRKIREEQQNVQGGIRHPPVPPGRFVCNDPSENEEE